MTEDVMTELRLSAVTSHVAMQTNVNIRKSPKIPKRVRLARSHISGGPCMGNYFFSFQIDAKVLFLVPI